MRLREEAIFAAVDRRGAEFSADFRRDYEATVVSQRACFRGERSADMVRRLAPCRYNEDW